MMRTAVHGDELLRKAHSIGQYYGFTPLSVLAMRARGSSGRSKASFPEAVSKLPLDPTAESIVSFLKQCAATGAAPSLRQPLFVWHTNIAAGRPAPKRAIVQFHALGTDRTLSETLIIRAAIALMRDLAKKDPAVRINSMGDKETRARYARELGSYFKRRAESLPEECLACAKRDALEAAELVLQRACADDLPAPTDHLSDASRRRFEDLLEYLEATETPYELARELISRGSAWNEMCFELSLEGERVAWGSRYNELARHFFTGAVPAAGVVLEFAGTGEKVAPPHTPRTHISFVHIGEEAKHLALRLAEELRKAHVPLTQDIGVESLTEQMRLAEMRRPSHLLIMGRKEALEGTAILRDRETQEETVIPLHDLAERLKAIAPRPAGRAAQKPAAALPQ